jgi:hypothetical protein
MKSIMEDRIRRIEEALRSDEKILMVAMKTSKGIDWNGVIYPNEKALDMALKQTLDEYQRVPLIIIEKLCGAGNEVKA